MKIDQLFSTETAGRFFVRIVISNRKNRQIDSGKLKVWFYKVYNPVENHGRFGNASQIRSAIFNKLSANFDRIQKSGDFVLYYTWGLRRKTWLLKHRLLIRCEWRQRQRDGNVHLSRQASQNLHSYFHKYPASSHRRRVYILSQNGNAGRRCAVIKGIIR